MIDTLKSGAVMWLPDGIMAFRLFVAAVAGGIIGFEREVHDHDAGLRIHSLVALAAGLFTVITLQLFETVQEEGGRTADPIRVVEAVTAGVAFIAAGAIIQGRGNQVKGLTTGAGMWLAGAVGVACGMGQYGLMAVTLIFAQILLRIVKWLKTENDVVAESDDQVVCI